MPGLELSLDGICFSKESKVCEPKGHLVSHPAPKGTGKLICPRSLPLCIRSHACALQVERDKCANLRCRHPSQPTSKGSERGFSEEGKKKNRCRLGGCHPFLLSKVAWEKILPHQLLIRNKLANAS